mgnify:CR=1 FL=1
MNHQHFFLGFLAYVILGTLRVGSYRTRLIYLSLLNLAFVAFLWTLRPNAPQLAWLGAYVMLIYGQFELTKRLVPKSDAWTWCGILAPVALMLFVRIVPVSVFSPIWSVIGKRPHQFDCFLGLSFMAFRLSFFAQEYKNKLVKDVTFLEYLNFAFFGPAILVGPITAGKVFVDGLRSQARPQWKEGILRIAMGCGKYFFLGAVLSRVTLEGIFGTGKDWSIRLIF